MTDFFPGDDAHEQDSTGVVVWLDEPRIGPSNRPGVWIGWRLFTDRENKQHWMRERMRLRRCRAGRRARAA